jgi:hypothetical protein
VEGKKNIQEAKNPFMGAPPLLVGTYGTRIALIHAEKPLIVKNLQLIET